VQRLERERDVATGIARDAGAAALRLRSAAGTLHERAAVLEAEAAGGRAAGTEAAGLLAKAEESAAEVRAGVAARVSVLEDLASSARDAAGKAREARAAAETAGLSAAAAEEELNRVITTGSAVVVSVENAFKGVDAVVEAAERARLIALNAALEASRSGGHGARAADDLRKLAEEASNRAQALAGSLAEARNGARAVSRAAQDAGKAAHQATVESADSTRGFETSWQEVDGMLTRLEAANAHAARLRDEAKISDRGRSAVEGASRIMARIEAQCAEIAALAAAMASESAEGAPGSPGQGSKEAKEKAVS
jgi:methyl-accepting chemotaxis protein